MTDPDPAWTEAQAQYDALIRELAETLDLDAGLRDALARGPRPIGQITRDYRGSQSTRWT